MSAPEGLPLWDSMTHPFASGNWLLAAITGSSARYSPSKATSIRCAAIAGAGSTIRFGRCRSRIPAGCSPHCDVCSGDGERSRGCPPAGPKNTPGITRPARKAPVRSDSLPPRCGGKSLPGSVSRGSLLTRRPIRRAFALRLRRATLPAIPAPPGVPDE
jgi:hypothetical protein